MTKRQGILALLGVIVARIARADEKTGMPSGMGLAAPFGPLTYSPRPIGVTISLDYYTSFTAIHNGETVTITATEMFQALKD